MTHKQIIELLFYVTNLIHFNHLNTESYSLHMAYGDAYDKLNSYKDSISEILLGIFGRIDSLNVGQLSVIQPIEICNEISNLSDKLKQYATENKLTDLVNESEEIKLISNKLRYLISLK